jgi:glycerate 2-kinase
MRVVIAPGSFGPELPPVEAAAAMAAGWASRAPADELVLAPVSDGGEGYVDVLQHALGGDLLAVSITDAAGRPTPGVVLLVDDTAYVEGGQAVAVGRPGTDPEAASSYGVGQLVAEAVGAGARRVVVGVGASGVVCNDGGAGLLAALGGTSEPDGLLREGARSLDRVSVVNLDHLRALLHDVALVVATDDEAPLLGLLGTTNVSGLARGLAAERIPAVDARLTRLADIIGRKQALLPGAGAGGGIGYALLLAGAAKAPGLGTVLAEIGLAARASAADLVVTGEKAFDLSLGSGRVVTEVAALAGSVVRPCIALSERLAVGSREGRALGVESAYATSELVGLDLISSPAERLATLANRVARTWSWSR